MAAPELRFRILNVFTRERERLTGNPLCVFEDGASLDAAAMQSLARQFNLSETTFILPSAQAAARVRIFTPEYEMPFAGHPTLGTAHVCRALGLGGDELALEMKAGVVRVAAAGDRWTLTAPEVSTREVAVTSEILAGALGLLRDEVGERPLWVNAGTEQLIVPLRSADAVRRASPSVRGMAALDGDGKIGMAYVFAYVEPGKTLARFFFPSGGTMLEDPATGSATANFGGWCLVVQRPIPLSIEISQGESAGRPSLLYLSIDGARRIRVGGEVIELGAGTIRLD